MNNNVFLNYWNIEKKEIIKKHIKFIVLLFIISAILVYLIGMIEESIVIGDFIGDFLTVHSIFIGFQFTVLTTAGQTRIGENIKKIDLGTSGFSRFDLFISLLSWCIFLNFLSMFVEIILLLLPFSFLTLEFIVILLLLLSLYFALENIMQSIYLFKNS